MHSAREQREQQCKAWKYNTNKRQINGQDNHNPEICPCLCLYFSDSTISAQNRTLLSIADMAVSSSWASDTLPCSYVTPQLQRTLPLKHHWAAKWRSTQITSEESRILFWRYRRHCTETIGGREGIRRSSVILLKDKGIWRFQRARKRHLFIQNVGLSHLLLSYAEDNSFA